MAYRALVVGCGGMGQGWMDTIRKNPRAELVGVVDVRPEAATAAAAKFGLAPERAFNDLRRAITVAKPDFVADITIPEAHCATTVAALGKGIPVIGEKPLAHSMAAARKMAKAAEKAGKLSMISQSRRYDRNHAALAATLRETAIGTVTTVNCDFYAGAHFGGFRDEMESPLVLDMAIHHFDLCRYLSGTDPVAVYAKEFNPQASWYKGDVAASIIFEMTGGVIFTYRGSWCAEGCHTSWNGNWRVIGTRGTLLQEFDQAPRGQRVKAGAEAKFNHDLEEVPIVATTVPGEGIHGSLNEFLDALDGKGTPQCEVHDNIKSLAMVFAAMESSRKGKRIPVRW